MSKEKVEKFETIFSKFKGLSQNNKQTNKIKSTQPELGLLVFSLIHFHAESKYSNEKLIFWKSLKILAWVERVKNKTRYKNVKTCWPLACPTHQSYLLVCTRIMLVSILRCRHWLSWGPPAWVHTWPDFNKVLVNH